MGGMCSSTNPYGQTGRVRFKMRGDKLIHRPMPGTKLPPIDQNALVLQREGEPYEFGGVEMVTFSATLEEVVLPISINY